MNFPVSARAALAERLELLADAGLTLVHCPKCDPEDYNHPAAEHCDECPRETARMTLELLRGPAPGEEKDADDFTVGERVALNAVLINSGALDRIRRERTAASGESHLEAGPDGEDRVAPSGADSGQAPSPLPPEATDLAEQLQISKIGHDATFRTLNDVKRELAHYKAGEQPRVEDRDREIAALKARPPAPPAAPRGQWMPIESAPKEGSEVDMILVFDPNYAKPVVAASWDRDPVDEGGQCWRASDALLDRLTPTHWMPLPAAPAPASWRGGEVRPMADKLSEPEVVRRSDADEKRIAQAKEFHAALFEEGRAQGRAEMLKEIEQLRRWVQDDIEMCKRYPVQMIREEGMWLILRELDRRWPRAQQAASEER